MRSNAILRVDSRDKHAHCFGQISNFVKESNFSIGVPNTVEGPQEVDCTAISSCKVGSSQAKKVYDIQDLWGATPKTRFGADPRDTFGVMCKRGLLPIDGGDYDKRWVSYFRADTGSLDAFDNVRSSMTLAQSSSTVASYWYKNWNETLPNGILPKGDTSVSSHDYVILDWKIKDGSTMFLIDAHLGYPLWMPREVFNDAVGKIGCGAYIPSTRVIDEVREKTILEKIKDACINAIILLKQLINQTTMQPIDNQPKSNSQLIVKWAKAIEKVEGSKPELCNPGNLKVSPLTQSWGATQGFKATDGGYIAKFPTYEKGFQALVNFLTLGAKNQLRAFHYARTLESFSKIYAGNPPRGYYVSVANDLGVSLDVDISTFL